MTAIEKLEANERKREAHSRARGKCQVEGCDKPISLSESHWSHIVPKTKLYLEQYGTEIINHEDNMVISCDKCNSKVLMDPKSHPLEAAEHLRKIKEKIMEESR